MGALQGALMACLLGGFIVGNTVYTYLSILLGDQNYICFVIGAVTMACGSALIGYLLVTFKGGKDSAQGEDGDAQ